jgi:hypothetical protein
VALTVSGLQALLSGLCGNWLAASDLDGTATSAAFLYPIARSLTELGIAPASPLTVADADLTAVTADQLPQLVDVAELWSIQTALQNYSKIDQTGSLGQKRFGHLRMDMERTLARKSKEVRQRYGFGRGSLVGGTVDLDFATTFDDGGGVIP